MIIDALKTNQNRALANQKKKKAKQGDADMNKTLKGVLINNHVKPQDNDLSFDEIQDSLLICDTPKYYELPQKETLDNNDSSFNVSKAMKPLLIGTALLATGLFGVSAVLKKSSKKIMETNHFEHLPDLAVNMNIKDETHFALYRAIRDPNYKNILGTVGVFMMTGLTLIAKNFIDGAKEIWLKKRSADLEKELQEKLIEVETNSFSGKLNVVNDLLSSNVRYFDNVLNKQTTKSNIFSGFPSFKGDLDDIQKEDEKKRKLKKNIKYGALTIGVIAGAIALGKFSFSNLRKTAQYNDKFANDVTERTIDHIKKLSEKGDKQDVATVTELLKSICAKPDFVKEIGQKFKLGDDEIKTIIAGVDEAKKTIFADAPTALGGIPKKIQYYCYIDENRGHLYNWILNPENKFTKYVFSAFTLTSSIGYLLKEGMDAFKEFTVMRENAKTELDLRKRLVDVEIKNFKSKKESAINPLLENFSKQVEEGKKSKEELKQLADNILLETKNGPPYVYT